MNFEETRKVMDSDEEVHFCWWLSELYESGYIDKYERAETYELSMPVKRKYLKQLKTKLKNMEQHVMHGASYTPDFKITWNESALDKFVTYIHSSKISHTVFYCDEKLETIVEIKGMFDRNNMIRLATTNIKWVFEKHNVLIELVKIPKLFKDTFCPKRYLETNKSNKKRSLKLNKKAWTPIKLKQYV